PLVIVSAYVGTYVAIYLVEVMESELNPFPLLHIMLSSALGIPLFFVARVIYERKNVGKKWLPVIYLLAALVVLLIYFSFPSGKDIYPTSYFYIRYAILSATVHLMVTFIPYISNS